VVAATLEKFLMKIVGRAQKGYAHLHCEHQEHFFKSMGNKRGYWNYLHRFFESI
jgi:hypothetical protein